MKRSPSSSPSNCFWTDGTTTLPSWLLLRPSWTGSSTRRIISISKVRFYVTIEDVKNAIKSRKLWVPCSTRSVWHRLTACVADVCYHPTRSKRTIGAIFSIICQLIKSCVFRVTKSGKSNCRAVESLMMQSSTFLQLLFFESYKRTTRI